MKRYSFKNGLMVICLFFLFCACATDAEKKAQFLSQGETFIKNGDYSNAVIQLKNAIEIDPDSAWAWELLAQAYLKMGDTQQGFNSLLRLEKIDPTDLDTAIQVASFYLLAQQIEEAETRVTRVLEKQPDHIPALYLQAGLLSRDPENLDQLAGIYEKIRTIDPHQPKAYLALARIDAARARHAEAETSLKKALELEPTSERVYKTLFDFYISRNDVPAAEALIKDRIAQTPSDPEPHIFLGSFYLARNEFEKAEHQFFSALEKDTDNLNAHMLTADLYSRQGQIDDAESHIRKVINLAPDNHGILTACADFYFSQKKIPQAQEILNDILNQRPGFFPARILKGRILAETNDLDAAEALFRKLIQEDPQSGQAYYLLGSVLEKKNDTAQAQSLLATAVEKNPNLYQARLLLGNIHFRQGDMALAETYARQILRQVPNHYQASILLGNTLMVIQQTEEARSIFETLTQAAPGNPVAFYRLGILEQSEKNYDQAILHLNRALEIDPDLMDVFSSLIAVYALQQRFDQAMVRCDDHLAARGENPAIAAVILNLKGNILLADNQLEKALITYEQAISRNPSFITPYLSLGKIFTAQGRIEDAIQIYTALLEEHPEQASAHTLAGTLYEQQGHIELAQTHYKKALEIEPDLVPALNNLAYLYADQGILLDQALDLARQARRQTRQVPAVMDTLGWVYFKKALYDSAVMEFEAAIELDGSNPIFFYHLGLTYHELGRDEDARTALETALRIQSDFKGADAARKLLKNL